MGAEEQQRHEVRLAATQILSVAGMSGYHTSVIVDDKEYFFDNLGVMVGPPLFSHPVDNEEVERPEDWKTEVLQLGNSSCDGGALVQALRSFFERGSYDVFHKNCNTFTDAALYFLTDSRLPARY